MSVLTFSYTFKIKQNKLFEVYIQIRCKLQNINYGITLFSYDIQTINKTPYIRLSTTLFLIIYFNIVVWQKRMRNNTEDQCRVSFNELVTLIFVK